MKIGKLNLFSNFHFQIENEKWKSPSDFRFPFSNQKRKSELWNSTRTIHDQVSKLKSISQVKARFKRGDKDSCIALNLGVLASSHQPSLQLQETSAFNLFKILI